MAGFGDELRSCYPLGIVNSSWKPQPIRLSPMLSFASVRCGWNFCLFVGLGIGGLDPSRAARRRRARPLLSYRRVPGYAWQPCHTMIASAWRGGGVCGGNSLRCTLVVFGGRGASLDYVGSGFLSHFLFRPVVPTLFLWQVSLLVTCFGASAGQDRAYLACRKLFRKGCFPHPVGLPRTVTVSFRPFEPRQIPPSPCGRALTGRLPQLAGPPSPPGKLFRTIRSKKPSPNTSGGAAMGCTCPQTRRSCQAVLRGVATVLSSLLCRKRGAHLVASPF